MAAIFQDGRQMDLCFMILLKNHGANCDTNLKFGRSVPSRSFIQMKVLAMKKINMAAIFQDGCQMDLSFIQKEFAPKMDCHCRGDSEELSLPTKYPNGLRTT